MTALLGATAGCSEEVTGPAPAVQAPPAGSDNPDGLAVNPGIACNAQLTTNVVVHGEGFSPIPIDVPNHPRLALPTLSLFETHALDGSPTPSKEIVYSGDPDKPVNLALLTWQSQKQMTFTIDQLVELPDGKKGEIEAAIYDVKVRNPNTNETQEPGAIAIVDKPTFAKVSPSVLCLAQQDRQIALTGTTFLSVDGKNPTLAVDGVSAPFPVTDLSSCTDIPHPDVKGKFCTAGGLTLPKGSIDPNYDGIVIQNPATAGCKTEEVVKLLVVPPPVLTKVEPPIACVHDEDRTFVIDGTDFLQIDGTNPKVTIAGKDIQVDKVDGCEALTADGPEVHQVQRCTKVNITVKAGGLDPGKPEIIVTNPDPAGCDVSNSIALTIVPPPTVTKVVPPLVCVDDGPRTVDVDGTDFLTVGGTPPAVAFDDVAVDPSAVAPGDCVDFPVDGLTVQQCTKLTVTIAKAGLSAGAPTVRVTNPDPAGCSDVKPGLLAVVPGPKITKAEPPLICAEDSDRTLVVTGTGFLQVGTELPAATLGGAAITTMKVDGCTPVVTNGLTVQSCTTIDVTVPKGVYTAGHPELAIVNPLPAGCTATSTKALTIPPVLAFAPTPQNFCVNSGTKQATISGTGFLEVGSTSFTVAVAGGTATAATSPGGCTNLGVDGQTVLGCTSFDVTVNTNVLPVGGVQLDVANPAPSSCTLSSTTALQIVSPPTITSVVPAEICSDEAKTLAITGTSFANGATITATPTGTTTGAVQATTVVVTGTTKIDATFSTGLPAGTYDVTVANAAGCSSTSTAALLVDPTPLVFYVDPPVLYSGISVETTIFTSGLTTNAKSVDLVNDRTQAVTSITGFKSPQRPNKILADIPAGLAAGKYTVRITSQIGCVGELPGAVDVTDKLTLSLDATTPIAPAYASPTEATAVTIKGTGFTDTPRAYLNPVASGAGTTATALRAVVFASGTQLTALVPANTPAGDYDLIVVNPGGEVGLAPAALHVTVKEPPVITAVTPTSLTNSADHPATIQGVNFDTAGVTVSLSCKLGTGAPTTSQATGIANLTTTSVDVTLPTATVPGGSICLVTLTNTADGASFTYSAISVKNPADNLNPWAASAGAMVEGRRGLGFVAGRPTNTSRYLYAIGGDAGAVASAKKTVEAVPSDVFGALGAWTAQRNSLPSARTLAGSARIGRFVYLVGGHDGTGATNTVLRSQILDPLAAPDFTDLDAALGNGTTGLDQGLWYYRVAATFPATDASNPNGESLPGEPFPVQLPWNPKKITLTLSWSTSAGATAYRIYRTPTAGAGAGALELLTTVTCGGAVPCRYTDTGGATQPGQTPLPTGSLGIWHQPATSTLGASREGLATVAAPNPTNASEWFLYAFGGRNQTGTYLASYEWARVTIAADGSQTMGGWTAGTRNIGAAKADGAAWVVTSSDSSIVASGQVVVFVGTGHTGANATTGEVTSGTINGNSGDLTATAGGTLDAEVGPSGQGLGAAGYGAAAGTVYVFGGEKSGGGLVTTDSSSAVGAGPSLANWNSLGGGSLKTQRSFCHTAQESAFFYTAGGTNGTQPLASVEQTVQ